MRLLFVGDLAPTGFGTVTTDLGRALLDLGQDVRFLSQNELGDLGEPFLSRTFVVEQRMGWPNAVEQKKLSISGVLDGSLWEDGWAPEAVLILGDFYAARGVIFLDPEGEEAFRRVPTYHYCPVEGVGLPPAWKYLWEIAQPVAMCEFGADQIAKVTGKRPPVVYHGVDTQAFYPVGPGREIKLGDRTLRSKDDCKDYFHIPRDRKVLLRTDTNVPRKQWPALMRAVAPVLASHPDTILVMHTRSSDEGGDLRDVRSHFPAEIASRMVNTGYKDRGFSISRADLCAMYNAADLYVSTSAEGFGLTIAEAVACGVPAVGLNYSAVPEVIGPAGLVVPAELVDSPYAFFWARPNEQAFGMAVSRLLDDNRERALMGAKGPYHVREKFKWSRAAEQFVSIVNGHAEVVDQSPDPSKSGSGPRSTSPVSAGSGRAAA